MSAAARLGSLLARVRGARPAGPPEPEPYVKGVDPIRDLRRCLPGYEPATVFDVGANVGQSAAAFADAFPAAQIHCFEPVAATFAELSERFAGHDRVRCTRCALGGASGTGTIALVRWDSSRATLGAGVPPDEVEATEEIEIRTLADVCRERAIDRIELLKIDTEGFDLDVLRGARELLAAQAIDVVEVEAAMNPENAVHVAFEELKAHLEAAGYRLFAIYEQKEEWPTVEPHLRRTNPVFISRRMIDAHRGHAPGSPP